MDRKKEFDHYKEAAMQKLSIVHVDTPEPN